MDLAKFSKKKSIFLLGPRQVGKSTLIQSLAPDLSINLADQETFLKHSLDFGLLRSLISTHEPKSVFIDEVQRIPEILNTVQSLIDEKCVPGGFFLTGSSARKLKKGGANLLPGRIIQCALGPLVLKELGYKINVKRDLKYGFLPGIYTERDNDIKQIVLESYSVGYLSEEIKSEALVRDLPSFARFVDCSTSLVGQFVDYSKLSKRAKVPRHQIARYFEIFEDTMVGYRIHAPEELQDRFDLVKHPKFYFFDVGVFNGLQRVFELTPERMGVLTEQVVFQQLFHSASALRKKLNIYTFRTRGGSEIDFFIKLENQNIAIEVKYSDNLIESDVHSLIRIKKEMKNVESFLFHLGEHKKKISGIWCLPLGVGLKELGL